MADIHKDNYWKCRHWYGQWLNDNHKDKLLKVPDTFIKTMTGVSDTCTESQSLTHWYNASRPTPMKLEKCTEYN